MQIVCIIPLCCLKCEFYQNIIKKKLNKKKKKDEQNLMKFSRSVRNAFK